MPRIGVLDTRVALLVALAVLVGAAIKADAQEGSVDVRVVAAEGRNAVHFDLVRAPLGLEDCLQEHELAFRLSRLPPDSEHIDVWVGSECHRVDSRLDAWMQTCRHLHSFEVPPGDPFQRTVELSARLVVAVHKPIGRDFRAGERVGDRSVGVIREVCAGRSTPVTLYFLPTQQPLSVEDVSGNWGSFELAIDTIAPPPPERVRVHRRDGTYRVQWSYEEGDASRGFRIYKVDTCDTRLLQGGNRVPRETAGLRRQSVDDPAARETTISVADGTGSEVAVAITAVDSGFNESVFSRVVCLNRTTTDAGGAALDAGPMTSEQGCAVASGESGAWLVVLMAGMAWRRRRGAHCPDRRPT